MTEGHCLCGALRYQIDGPFVDMLHCHCSMCRKHHGTPFATWAAAPIAGFRWLTDTSSLATYRSSERGHREFCRICGSVAPMVEESLGMVIAPAGNLEGDPGIRPTKHMFVGSKADWYEITDDLPQHEEYPPEFGMPSTPRALVELKPGVAQGSCLCGEVAYEITTRRCACSCATARAAARAAAPRTARTSSTTPRVSATRGAGLVEEFQAARRAVFHHSLLPELRLGTAARLGGAQHRRGAGRFARQRAWPSRPPHTSSSTRRRPGSTSPTSCRSSRRCPRAAESRWRRPNRRRCIAHILPESSRCNSRVVRAPLNPSRQPAISCPLTPTRSSRVACSRCRR